MSEQPQSRWNGSAIAWSLPGAITAGVIALFGAFALGLLPIALQKVRTPAAQSVAMNNLKQFGIGLHTLTLAFDCRVPPSVGRFPTETDCQSTFWFHLLPFIEQEALHWANLPADLSGTVSPGFSACVGIYVAPYDPSNRRGTNRISYATNHAVFGDAARNYVKMLSAKGLSNTIVFVERASVHAGGTSTWANPAPLNTYITGGAVSPLVVLQSGQTTSTLPQDAAHAFSNSGCTVLLGDGAAWLVKPGSIGYAIALDPESLQELPNDW